MANPKEKIFLLYLGMAPSPEFENLRNYIEKEMGESLSKEPTKYLYWLRAAGGRMYILGTLENTVWTADRIISKIQKNVKGIHALFCVEIQGCYYQGLMADDFWKFLREVQDLTKTVTDHKRFGKLRKLKVLIDKKEDLKRKEVELANRESDLHKKRELLSEEEELLKKEEEIRKQEAELARKEKELNKKKKFLGLF